MKSTKTRVLQFVGAIGFSLAACSSHPHSTIVGGFDKAAYDNEVASGIERLRAATRAYLTLDSAVAAGYPARWLTVWCTSYTARWATTM